MDSSASDAATHQTILMIVMFVMVLVTGFIVFFVFKKFNRVEKSASRDSYMQGDQQCPKCKQLMTKGFTTSPRGILFLTRGEKKPGAMMNYRHMLPNTFKFGSVITRMPPGNARSVNM
jgi:hypothetical protein